tara:strand:+ start:3927 stop:6650 length:2724 start_codon:yes stop_codon:yes gene_type:complete
MIRKIALLFTVISVGILLYYGYEKMRGSQKTPVDIYTQVPSNAVAIIEINHPNEQWNDLLTNNIIWEEIHVFESVDQVENWISFIDSSITHTTFEPYLGIDKIVLSILPTATNGSMLFQMQLNPKIKDTDVTTILNTTFGWTSTIEKENGIITIQYNSKEFYGLLNHTVFTLSASKESLIALTHNSENILTDINFNRVKKTSSKNTKIRFFIEPNRFSKIVSQSLSEKAQFELALFPSISSWVELDVAIKPDEISMGGFLNGVDSLSQWVTLFKNQEPIKPQVVEIMPDRTAFLLHFGFSNFIQLRKKYVTRASDQLGSNHDLDLIRWDTMYDISIKNDFISWIDNEIALSVLEPDQYAISNDVLVWIGSSDALTLNATLSDMALKVANKDGSEFESITYKGYQINKLNIPDFLATTLGEPFKYVTKNYFIQMEDYIVFANSPSTLQWTIERFERGKTLSKNPNYQNFSKRISDESNVFIYSNIASSPNLYKLLANNAIQKEIVSYKEWLQKFQVLSIQVSYEDDDLYYVNNFLKYNPVYKKESNTIWEAPLLTISNFKPALVKNHYTQATEIVTQDTNNTVYLINNKGKVLWTRTIDGPIISKIQQIDALKNNKLQLLFNTQNKIYVLDRNGNNLDNFPISLPSKALCSLVLVDYEQTKNYRILVPTFSGDILNYGIDGKKVTGWNYTNTGIQVSQPIEFIKINNKDYLICMYANGTIKALNRRGQIRIDFNSSLNFELTEGFGLEKGTSLDNTYMYAVTKNKEVISISLTDKKTRLFDIGLDSINNVHYFDSDSDGSIEIIVSNNHRIAVYKTDGNKIFDIRPIDEINSEISIYKFPDGNKLGYVTHNEHNEHNVILLKLNGDIVYPFPLKGQTLFSIQDINNDGRFNMITADKEGILLNYTLDF